MLTHDPLDALAAHVHALPAQLQPHPRRPIRCGELVRCADLDDHLQQLRVLQVPAAGCGLAGPPVVVGRRWDTQDPQYEIDRERVGVDEAHDVLRVGAISEAKYALAARSTSLTRLSSAFSRLSRRFSSAMSVVG